MYPNTATEHTLGGTRYIQWHILLPQRTNLSLACPVITLIICFSPSPSQSTNSTRYQHLIDKLFSTEGPQLTSWSFYLEPADNKRDRPKRVRNMGNYGYDCPCEMCVFVIPPPLPEQVPFALHSPTADGVQ